MMVLAACRACHQGHAFGGRFQLAPRWGRFGPLAPAYVSRLYRVADYVGGMARSASDAEVGLPEFLSIEKAYRSQAEVLKAKKKAGKKRR